MLICCDGDERRDSFPFANRNDPGGAIDRLTDTQQMDLKNETMGPLQRVAQLPPRWQKLPNSKCKVPTESLLSLNTSERGCSAIRFSHNGHFLACAEVNKPHENNLVSIFEVDGPSFIKVFSLWRRFLPI